MVKKRVVGIVKYLEIEMGFWGIETDNEKYFPINLPEQLKTNKAEIICSLEILEYVMTSHNWGRPCKVISFMTLSESN